MSDPRIRRSSINALNSITNSLDNQMAYSRRSTYRSYGRYRRRYSSYGGSFKRRSRGQFRAARNQNDSSRQVLKWSHVQQITLSQVSSSTGNGDLLTSKQGYTYFNAWRALYNSGFYNNFAEMFDQIKLNGVKVKITLLSADTTIFSSTINPVFVSAWDRNGATVATSDISEPFKFVSSYGSAITKPLTTGANFGMTRSIYASTMAEKSQYIPTSSINQISGSLAADDNSSLNIGWQFIPTLLLGVFSNVAVQSNSTLNFNVEWQFDVTFRGTRNDTNASP